MFQIADSMADGRFFWRALERLRRPPFDCMSSFRSATLGGPAHGLALILAPSDDTGSADDRRVFVQLLDIANGEMLVDAMLNGNLQYVRGNALGVSADEMAAAETLTMFGSDLLGDWAVVEGGLLDELNEEGEYA